MLSRCCIATCCDSKKLSCQRTIFLGPSMTAAFNFENIYQLSYWALLCPLFLYFISIYITKDGKYCEAPPAPLSRQKMTTFKFSSLSIFLLRLHIIFRLLLVALVVLVVGGDISQALTDRWLFQSADSIS